MKKEQSLTDFKQSLAKQGFNVVLRQNSQGYIYGLTYVDLKINVYLMAVILVKNLVLKVLWSTCVRNKSKMK